MTDQTLPPCPLDDCGGGEHHYHEWTNQDLECTHAAAQFANFTRCYGPHREPSPLRLPDAETLAREVWGHLTDEVMAQAGKDLVQIAQRYLDALARLVPRWVPVPEEATIPEGVRYRLERANGHNSEWRGTLDRGPSLRSGSNAYFVRSTDLDKLTYPDPDADLKRRIRDAIAASVDSTTHCDGEWDDLAARVIGLVREGGGATDDRRHDG